MIDHCISALRKERDEKAYREYITDALKAIVDNTARFAGGVTLNARYAEIIAPPVKEEQESRTAVEVVDNIRNKIRKMRKT